MAPPSTDPRGSTVAGARTVVAAFLAMATVFGVAYSFGAFLAPMATEFGTGSGATSVVFSVTACCWFVLGSLSGRAADRYGPRPVLLVGAAALLAGMLGTAAVTDLRLGYVTYGLGVGVAVACGYVPTVAAVGGWYDGGRATALALAVAGIGVGTVVGPPLAAALVVARGWREAHAVLGTAGAAVLVLCAVLARRPPEAVGDPPPPVRDLVRTRDFRSLYASTLLASVALFVPFVFLPVYAAGVGVEPVAAAGLVGVIGVASVVGRLAIGPVADRLGRIRVYRWCFAVLAGSFAIWLGARSWPGLVAFAAVLGVGYGGWIALQPTVVAEVFGARGLGGLVGLVYTAAGLGALVGPPVAGLLVDGTGGYTVPVLTAGVFALGAYLTLLPLGGRPGRGAAGRTAAGC